MSVFGEALCPSIACGLSLAALVQDHGPPPNTPTPDQVLKTRSKIRHGLILSLEAEGVWTYNLSNSPLFVNSARLGSTSASVVQQQQDTSQLVARVPPGECALVWREGAATSVLSGSSHGPAGPPSVRISFAKGWGRGYSRTEIIACPCWLELLLAPPR